MLVALLLVAGCGGGSGGGGEGEGGDATDLEAQAAQIEVLLDKIDALPTTATSAQDFSAQLAPLREEVQTLQEEVEIRVDLRSLRTQLGRVEGLLANDDLETAKTATEQLISVQQLRVTIAAIKAAAGGG